MLILQLGRHFSETDGSSVQSQESKLWNATQLRNGSPSGIKLQVAVDRSIHVEATKYRRSESDMERYEETAPRVWHSVCSLSSAAILGNHSDAFIQPKVYSDPHSQA